MSNEDEYVNDLNVFIYTIMDNLYSYCIHQSKLFLVKICNIVINIMSYNGVRINICQHIQR